MKDPYSLFGSEIYVLLNETLIISAYPRSKWYICIDQWLGKYFCILGKIQAKRGVGWQVCFVPYCKCSWWIWGGEVLVAQPQENFALYPHLSLETVFAILKLTQNCYLKIWTYTFLFFYKQSIFDPRSENCLF